MIIGLSGGIDSTLTCEILARTLSAEQIHVLIVKNKRYPLDQQTHVGNYLQNRGLDYTLTTSQDILEKLCSRFGVQEDDTRQHSTLDARITDLYLRTLSTLHAYMYIGTINATERMTGWFPKGALFGDLCPIGGLLKHEVSGLARFLGLSENLIDSVACSATSICSGCGELESFSGISYVFLDRVLYSFREGTLDALKNESSLKEMESIEIILSRIKEVRHKNILFPPFPKVFPCK